MAGLFGFLIFTQMPAGAATVCPVAVFRDQTLQTHPASGPEKVWTDLADLEGRDEYPVWPSPQQSRQEVARFLPARSSLGGPLTFISSGSPPSFAVCDKTALIRSL